MITPRSTRCSARLRRCRRPSSLQKGKKNKLTTFWPREDTWETLRTLRPTGSDHRCVMALLWSTCSGRTPMPRRKRKNMRRDWVQWAQTNRKNINIEMSELEERYQEIVDTIKKTPPEKEMKYMTQEITRKNKSKERTPQQQKLKAHLQKPKHKRSKEEAWSAAAQQQTNRVFQLSLIVDVRTDGRLLPEGVVMKRKAVNVTWRQGSDCRNSAHTVMIILNTIQKNILLHKCLIRVKRQVLSYYIPAAPRASSRTTTKKRTWRHLQQQKVSEDFPDKDAEILRLNEERRSTPNEEKQRLKGLSKCLKNASEEKEWRDSRTFKESLKTSKVYEISRESNQQRRKVLITKNKNDKGESITSRRGIADLFGEFYKRLYEDNEKDDSEHEVNDDGNHSNTDVHNNDTEETAGIPEITTEVLQTAINKLKKANPWTTKEFDPKTLKIVVRRREMVRQIFSDIIKRKEFTPEDWKRVTIKVIHKKGDVENVSNCRPICSLPALYKLF